MPEVLHEPESSLHPYESERGACPECMVEEHEAPDVDQAQKALDEGGVEAELCGRHLAEAQSEEVDRKIDRDLEERHGW